ncbi:type II secretion system F family protein [Lacunimicrobium album]
MATTNSPAISITPKPEFAGILKQQERFATSDRKDTSNQINSWFDLVMVQSGIDYAPSFVIFLSMFSALIFGGAAFVIQEDFLTTALSAMVGAILPLGVILSIRARRQTVMLNQMPNMVDELARAAKTGRSLDQCIHLVAHDTPSPLGDELKDCSRKMRMGLHVGDALSNLTERTGLSSMKIFTMAISVHQTTGGDLVSVLERLSRTLRDRLQFLGRLRAATAASRATAILMIAIPPLILVFFIYRDPNYFSTLMNSSWGRGATFMGIALEIIGALWVLRILQTSKRT